MNKIKQYLIACVALFTLTACPDEDDTIPMQTYKQDVTLPSNASELTITLNSLSSAIEMVKNAASWLIVEQQFYTSGSPQIKLRTTENTGIEERRCKVTVTATSGDNVILRVTQEGTGNANTEGTDMDDLHGTVSEKPAFSRRN